MTAKKKKRASLVTMLLLKFPSGNAVTCVEIIGWLIAGYFCKMRMPRLSSFLCHRVPRAAWRLRFRKAGYGFLRNASPTEFLYLRRDDSCSGNGFGIRGEKRDDRSNCAVMFLATKWTIARKFFSSSNYQFQKCTYVSLTREKKLCYLYGSIGNGDRVALVVRSRNSFPSLGTRGFDLMGDDMTQRAAVDRYSIYSFVTKRWTRWRDEFAEAKAPIVGLRGRSSHLSRSKRRDATLPLKRWNRVGVRGSLGRCRSPSLAAMRLQQMI